MEDTDKITKEEILKEWEYYLDYLVDILNKDYDLEQAIDDIKGFRSDDAIEALKEKVK